jgi:ketosteroid isomerase-like protein
LRQRSPSVLRSPVSTIEFVDIWEIGDGTVVAVLDVHYRRLDGRELNLPCCNVFRVSDGLVRDYRIYMDVHPVITA